MTYTLQPITDFSIFTTPRSERKGVQFKASWSTTVEQLDRELENLEATDVILEIAVAAGDIRLDGQLRANARPSHPGVRLSFQSKHGSLSYTCDTYVQAWSYMMPSWQANIRAIVLTLEALRAVDRYGATKGEQYAGFKALGAGTGIVLDGLTEDQAMDILHEHAGDLMDYPDRLVTKEFLHKRARAKSHPDRNDGDQTAWDAVERAARALGMNP